MDLVILFVLFVIAYIIFAEPLYSVYHVEAFGRTPVRHHPMHGEKEMIWHVARYEYVIPSWAYLVITWVMYLAIAAALMCHVLIDLAGAYVGLSAMEIGVWCVWLFFMMMLHLWPVVFFKYAHLYIGAIIATLTFAAGIVLIVLWGIMGFWIPFGLYFVPTIGMALFMGINWYFAVKQKAMYPGGIPRQEYQALETMGKHEHHR